MTILYKRFQPVLQDAPRGVNSLVARADMANSYLHYSRKKHQTRNNRHKEEFDSKYVVQLLFKFQDSNALLDFILP